MSRRYRRRYGRCLSTGQQAAVAAVAGVVLAGAAHGPAAVTQPRAAAPARDGTAASKAIAYVKAQLGKPYVWGGTGPGSFDCSGLVMEAYQAAGVDIPRTSQEQWARGPQVSQPRRGDLVFFAGGDGTWSAPGHVGLVLNPARHIMIDAYGAGIPVRYDTYGLPTSAVGLTGPVGFTRPWEHS